MRKVLTCCLGAASLFGGTTIARAQATVSNVSSWPEAAVLHKGEKLQVTTFDMPGMPFPCRVKSVSVDQLVCGKTRDRQLRAFDRASVQSIVVAPHPRHGVSPGFWAGSGLALVGGLACAAAGAGVPCAGLLLAGLIGLLGGEVASQIEAFRGPTDARTIYVAAPPPGSTASGALM